MPPLAYLTILKNSIYAIDQIQHQIEVLSQDFEGDVWVVGPTDSEARIGRFLVHTVKRRTGEGVLRLFRRLYAQIARRAESVSRERAGPKLLVTYDPFRNGLLAILLKRRFGWQAILEVNGAHGNADSALDINGRIRRAAKRLQFKLIGRFTLARADGIRLLYHNQLRGLAHAPHRAVIRHYFDNVPLGRFPPKPEEPFLLHVGYPFYCKGVDTLVAAFNQVRDEFPEWKLLLIGHQLIDHLPTVPAGVECRPGMTNVEVADYISRCGCYVLASRSEAMGRVLIEAAAAGKARIAARVDGTYTVVEDEVDGLMFSPADADDLARQLRRVMGSRALRDTLGAAARQRAWADFSDDRYRRHVAEMVRAVIAASNARG